MTTYLYGKDTSFIDDMNGSIGLSPSSTEKRGLWSLALSFASALGNDDKAAMDDFMGNHGMVPFSASPKVGDDIMYSNGTTLLPALVVGVVDATTVDLQAFNTGSNGTTLHTSVALSADEPPPNDTWRWAAL